MQSIKVYIPMLPPSVNHCYKRSRWGGLILSKDGVDFKRIVAFKVRREGISFTPCEKMKLTIEFHSPRWITKKKTVARSDISNLIKISEDAFMEALKIDDKNVFELSVLKVPSESSMTIFSLQEITV